MVPHGDGNRALVGRDGHVDAAALGVLDRVDEQVAQDALDPARAAAST